MYEIIKQIFELLDRWEWIQDRLDAMPPKLVWNTPPSCTLEEAFVYDERIKAYNKINAKLSIAKDKLMLEKNEVEWQIGQLLPISDVAIKIGQYDVIKTYSFNRVEVHITRSGD